jgi:hypothetical protein
MPPLWFACTPLLLTVGPPLAVVGVGLIIIDKAAEAIFQ